MAIALTTSPNKIIEKKTRVVYSEVLPGKYNVSKSNEFAFELREKIELRYRCRNVFACFSAQVSRGKIDFDFRWTFHQKLMMKTLESTPASRVVNGIFEKKMWNGRMEMEFYTKGDFEDLNSILGRRRKIETEKMNDSSYHWVHERVPCTAETPRWSMCSCRSLFCWLWPPAVSSSLRSPSGRFWRCIKWREAENLFKMWSSWELCTERCQRQSFDDFAVVINPTLCSPSCFHLDTF